MNKITKVILAMLLCFVAGFLSLSLCRNVFANGGEQALMPLNNKIIQSIIKKDCESLNTIEEIADYSNELTAELLYFTMTPEFRTPNELSLEKAKGTHCVGYSMVCASICNYAFAHKGLNAKCRHMRGDVYWLGINLTSIAKNLFFALGANRLAAFCKDHDFVLIENYETGEIISLDPSIYDLLGFNLKTINK